MSDRQHVPQQLRELAQLCRELAYYLRKGHTLPINMRHVQSAGAAFAMAYRFLTKLRDHPLFSEMCRDYPANCPVVIFLRDTFNDAWGQVGMVRQTNGEGVEGWVYPCKNGPLVSLDTIKRLEDDAEGVAALAAGIAAADPAEAEQRDGTRQSGNPGRPRRYDWKKDQAIAEEWQCARDAGTTKKEFARDKSLSLKGLNRILNRHAARARQARKKQPVKRSN